MTKSKFIRLTLPISLNELAGKISKNVFNDESTNGFDLISIQRNVLQARFIEKLTFMETITDPFGHESTYEGISYNVVEFEITEAIGKICILRIVSPPRSINSFRSELYKLCGFGLTLSDTPVDVVLFLNNLKLQLSPHPIKITNIKARGIRLSTESSACIDIVSSDDALKDLLSNYDGEYISVTKAKIRVRSENIKGNIEISQSGLVTYDDAVTEVVEELMSKLVIGEIEFQ